MMEIAQDNPVIKLSIDDLNDLLLDKIRDENHDLSIPRLNFFHCTTGGQLTHLGIELVDCEEI